MREGGAGWDAIGAFLGRTALSVRTRLRYGVKRPEPVRGPWTDDEVQYLIRKHGQCAGAQAIANHLGRPRGEVYRKATEQGLLFHEQRPWDEEQDKLLLAFENKPQRAAAMLRRSLPQVLQRLKTLRASSGISPSTPGS